LQQQAVDHETGRFIVRQARRAFLGGGGPTDIDARLLLLAQCAFTVLLTSFLDQGSWHRGGLRMDGGRQQRKTAQQTIEGTVIPE